MPASLPTLFRVNPGPQFPYLYIVAADIMAAAAIANRVAPNFISITAETGAMLFDWNEEQLAGPTLAEQLKAALG